jgi:hypothetical protein
MPVHSGCPAGERDPRADAYVTLTRPRAEAILAEPVVAQDPLRPPQAVTRNLRVT